MRYEFTNNCSNKVRFDKVIAKIKWCSFFASQCIWVHRVQLQSAIYILSLNTFGRRLLTLSFRTWMSIIGSRSGVSAPMWRHLCANWHTDFVTYSRCARLWPLTTPTYMYGTAHDKNCWRLAVITSTRTLMNDSNHSTPGNVYVDHTQFEWQHDIVARRADTDRK